MFISEPMVFSKNRPHSSFWIYLIKYQVFTIRSMRTVEELRLFFLTFPSIIFVFPH